MTGPQNRGRFDALGRLMGAIADVVDAGGQVPCLNEDRGHLWLSENPEAVQEAAHACLTCPALEACRSYVTAWPEPSGVWAGRVGRREVAR
jgi:hypothetical protein